jgi:hypothetical protein
MCADASTERSIARADYLGAFVRHPAWRTSLSAHHAVPGWALRAVRESLERVHSSVTKALGLDCEPPGIFMYPTIDALRAHSCAGRSAVAYYDGAIHLALLEPAGDGSPSPRTSIPGLQHLSESLKHEYVHHVLLSNDIGKPIWFQEGAAMQLAHDMPQGYWSIWRKHPIQLRQMVDGFSGSNAAPDPVVFYAQSYVMTEFLERLCLKLHRCGLQELTAALKTGRATPVTLFDWAISQRGSDLVRTSRLPLWDDYAQLGDFAPATKHALLHRPDPR